MNMKETIAAVHAAIDDGRMTVDMAQAALAQIIRAFHAEHGPLYPVEAMLDLSREIQNIRARMHH